MSAVASTLILYAAMLIVTYISIGRPKSIKEALSRVGFKDTNIEKQIALAIYYLVIMFIATFAIEGALHYLGFAEDLSIVPRTLLKQNPLDLLILAMAAGFVEEIFFRGYLQRQTNIIFASFMFALAHLGFGSISEVIGVFVLGIILGIEYKKSGSLFAPVLSHYLYDFIVLTAIFGIG
ncbi:MAG: CPBP family intramembrane metalloprotease [DPANN group archaeon]|nr:CPBP family intramembrane metalloprotease [DPANN group archaeon]